MTNSDRKHSRTLSVINRLAEASRERPPEQPIKALRIPSKITDGLRQATQSHDEASAMVTFAEPSRAEHKNARGSVMGSPGKPRTAGTGSQLAPRHTLNVADEKQPDLIRRATSTRSSTFQTQRQEEIRVAEAWNQMLQNPATRSNNEVCEKFWSEIKSRMMARYGSVAQAFKQADTSGDGKVSFIEFADMLRVLHLPLDMRISRAMFEIASCGARDLLLLDFMPLLMEKTIQKFKNDFEGFNKKQERVRTHMHTFLHQLASSSEATLHGAADRLQRKLTMAFCREFWQMLRESLAKVHSDGDLDRSVFLKTINSMVGSQFAVVEVTFLMRIFDRIDLHRAGSIHLRMLMTTLVLVSEERRTETKLGFLFEVFDTDFDGCLLYEQILDMVRCICAQRHIIEDAPNRVSPDFQEELAQQDGQRHYECLFWHLQRTGKLDSDIVTWKELWQACENLPEVVSVVVPGFFRIRWVIHPAPEENDPKANMSPSIEQPTLSSGPLTISQRLGPSPRSCASEHDNHHSEQHHHHLNVRGNSRRSSKNAWQSAHDTGVGDARRTSKVVAWETPPREKDPTALEKLGLSSTAFKRTVTNRFLASLRNCGEARYGELQEGFKSVEELVAGKRDSLSVEEVDPQSPAGAAVSNPGAANFAETRPGSAATMRRQSSEITRPGSSPAMPGRKGSRALQRVSSAPTLVSKQLNGGGSSTVLGSSDSQHQPWTPGRPKSNVGNGRIPASAAELPRIGTQKWGLEAADRFKMHSSVKNSRNEQRQAKGSCVGAEPFGYKCQLCLSQHMMLTSF